MKICAIFSPPATTTTRDSGFLRVFEKVIVVIVDPDDHEKVIVVIVFGFRIPRDS